MNKIPRISGNTMIKYLINQGFIITSRKGSHVALKKNSDFTTVPAGNNILKIGLFLGILSDSMISKKKFVSDYNIGQVK